MKKQFTKIQKYWYMIMADWKFCFDNTGIIEEVYHRGKLVEDGDVPEAVMQEAMEAIQEHIEELAYEDEANEGIRETEDFIRENWARY